MLCGGRKISLLLTVILFVKDVLGDPLRQHPNDTVVRDDYFEDALDKWLGNFGTYTFMVEQDVDDADDVEEDFRKDHLAPEESMTYEDEDEEGYEKTTSAPIILSVKRAWGLLNPDVDYNVKIESLVAEGGSVLVLLENFENETNCGVGGFSLSDVALESSSSPEGRLNISHLQEGNRSTTVVAFAVDSEGDEANITWAAEDESSEWEEHSRNLWWVMGKLAGGGVLNLVFTPPDCGCLMINAYYALPIWDNLTLVVGPEAYKSDMSKLLCVEPPSHRVQNQLIGHEFEEDEEIPEGGLDDTPEEYSGTTPSGVSRKVTGRGHGKWAAKKKAKLQRKKMRQEARQTIREAGRRVTRHRVKKHMRQRRRDEVEEEEEEASSVDAPPMRGRGRWAKKQARKAARRQGRKTRKSWKGKKPWKKHRKFARKNKRRNKLNRRIKHGRNQNATEVSTPVPQEAFEEDLDGSDASSNTTTIEPLTEDDALADLLLGDEEEEGRESHIESDSDPDVTQVTSTDGRSGRGGRRRQRNKGGAKNWHNKIKRKGTRFCCKRGIKFKKSQLLLNGTSEESHGIQCNASESIQIISTFAQHEYGIDDAQCSARFETCCSKFTMELWESVKAKKVTRKVKHRKQQRKAARQQKRRQHRAQRRLSTKISTSEEDSI